MQQLGGYAPPFPTPPNYFCMSYSDRSVHAGDICLIIVQLLDWSLVADSVHIEYESIACSKPFNKNWSRIQIQI